MIYLHMNTPQQNVIIILLFIPMKYKKTAICKFKWNYLVLCRNVGTCKKKNCGFITFIRILFFIFSYMKSYCIKYNTKKAYSKKMSHIHIWLLQINTCAVWLYIVWKKYKIISCKIISPSSLYIFVTNNIF